MLKTQKVALREMTDDMFDVLDNSRKGYLEVEDMVRFSASLEFLLLGRPFWGQGGSEQMRTLPEGREKDAVVAFLSSLSAYQVEVLSVERVQNETLWRTYAAKKETMRARSGATVDECERLLFHGTDEDTAPKIVAQGFNRSFCGKNATMYGKGVYFAKEAEYSARDIYR